MGWFVVPHLCIHLPLLLVSSVGVSFKIVDALPASGRWDSRGTSPASGLADLLE